MSENVRWMSAAAGHSVDLRVLSMTSVMPPQHDSNAPCISRVHSETWYRHDPARYAAADIRPRRLQEPARHLRRKKRGTRDGETGRASWTGRTGRAGRPRWTASPAGD